MASYEKISKSPEEMRCIIRSELQSSWLSDGVEIDVRPVTENARGENFELVFESDVGAIQEAELRQALAPVLGKFSLA